MIPLLLSNLTLLTPFWFHYSFFPLDVGELFFFALKPFFHFALFFKIKLTIIKTKNE